MKDEFNMLIWGEVSKSCWPV